MKNISLPWVLLGGLLVAACSQEPVKSTTAVANNGNGVKGHMAVLNTINNNELRLLMRRLDNLMHERNLTEQEMDTHRRNAYSKVVKAADGMGQTIGSMLAAKPRLNLSPADEAIFDKMAKNLLSESQELKAYAQSQQMDQVQATLQKMNGTCSACHELFRDFSKTGEKK